MITKFFSGTRWVLIWTNAYDDTLVEYFISERDIDNRIVELNQL